MSGLATAEPKRNQPVLALPHEIGRLAARSGFGTTETVKVVVVGGSASNVGKTTLAARLVREHAARTTTVAMKVSVREKPCETTVRTLRPGEEPEHRRDTGTLLGAGAQCVVWVTVHRPAVRTGLALGLATARRLRPATIVVESTSAGIELRRIDDSWFVAGDGEWKPWADRHRARADHVVRSADVFDPAVAR